MTSNTPARAPVRALVSAAVIGSLTGLAIGTAYMGGSLAKSMNVKAKAERLADAADSRYSEQALIDAAGGLDQSALAVARRHDPYTVAGGAARDRQATAFAARLEAQEAQRAGLRRVNVASTAVRPFRMAGALDASRDLDCLAQAVYYEARGEGVAGMRAVAQVVLNRVRHPAFPKTVCGVVYQGAAKRTGCQFSFTCNGTMRFRKEAGAWRRARDVASKAMAGYVMPDVGNATHFHTTGVAPGWRNSLLRVAQVGTHVFYKFGGRSGSSNAFRYEPRPSSGREAYQPVYASLAPPVPAADAQLPYKVLFTGAKAEPEAAKPVVEAAKPAPGKPAEPVQAEPSKPAAPAAAAPAETTATAPAV